MKPRRIDLRIEELVLEGVGGARPADLAGPVERELGRLLLERGLPPSLSQGGAKGELDGGTIRPGARAGAEGLGTEIARAIHRGEGR